MIISVIYDPGSTALTFFGRSIEPPVINSTSFKPGTLLETATETILHPDRNKAAAHGGVAFFFECIAAISIAGANRQFQKADVLIAIGLIECVILALNGGRCPLTDLAGRHSGERMDNFDIYLPLWLAGTTKQFLERYLSFRYCSCLENGWFPESKWLWFAVNSGFGLLKFTASCRIKFWRPASFVHFRFRAFLFQVCV
jgi:hypothetical protein